MVREGSTGKSRRANREELLTDIINYGEKIIENTAHLSEEELTADDIRYDATLYRLQCVSEATTQLLIAYPEIRERYPELPWAQIKGIANVTRHAYRFIAPDVVWGAISTGDLATLVTFARRELEMPK